MAKKSQSQKIASKFQKEKTTQNIFILSKLRESPKECQKWQKSKM